MCSDKLCVYLYNLECVFHKMSMHYGISECNNAKYDGNSNVPFGTNTWKVYPFHFDFVYKMKKYSEIPFFLMPNEAIYSTKKMRYKVIFCGQKSGHINSGITLLKI